jgi:mono/diheme cytochrome c family protein
MPKRMILLFGIAVLVLTGCNVSLASDITPPPNYTRPTAAPTTAVAQVVYPVVPPDPAAGALLYAEKCVPCHGISGKGDGPQATQLSIAVPAIGSTTLAHRSRPMDWFNIITTGRMDRFMPPFKSLSDRQRWDIVSYVYTLSAPASEVQKGKSIYEAKCLACHGTTGAGDGPQSAGKKLPNWSDPSRLAQRSPQDLFTTASNGVSPNMPAFASQLAEDERWAVAAYIRTLSFATGATTAPVTTATPATVSGTPVAQTTPQATQPSTPQTTPGTPSSAVFAGTVTRTTGGSLPAGLKVTLEGYDGVLPTPTFTVSTDTQADGSFRFADVPVVAGRVFMASVKYENLTFNSDPVHSTDIQPGVDVPLKLSIYDTSTDASTLTAQRMHIFLDFPSTGVLQVAELYIVNNPTDKVIVGATQDAAVLTYDLPDGVTNLEFQDSVLGERYLKTEKGFGDRSGMMPGSGNQVLFAYQLSYTGSQLKLTLPVSLSVDAVVVMMPAGGMALQSAQLKDAGQREVEGGNLQLYTASNLTKGSTIEINLNGQPSVPGTATTSGTPTELIIGLLVFGVVLLGGGWWYIRQNRQTTETVEDALDESEETEQEEEEADETTLLDDIVALDDLFQAGQLPEEAYNLRRKQLKDRLRAVRDLPAQNDKP